MWNDKKKKKKNLPRRITHKLPGKIYLRFLFLFPYLSRTISRYVLRRLNLDLLFFFNNPYLICFRRLFEFIRASNINVAC